MSTPPQKEETISLFFLLNQELTKTIKKKKPENLSTFRL
jgi:hypothetical protein